MYAECVRTRYKLVMCTKTSSRKGDMTAPMVRKIIAVGNKGMNIYKHPIREQFVGTIRLMLSTHFVTLHYLVYWFWLRQIVVSQ